MPSESRRQFSREFKLEAVKRSYEDGQSVTQVARELGIGINLLYKWRFELAKKGPESFPGSGYLTPPNTDLAKLQKENKRLQMENDILKKSLSLLSKDIKLDSE